MADVEYDFGADVTAAERAIARLESKTEKLERQLKSNARTSRRGASSAVSDFRKMAGGISLATVGYQQLTRVIGAAFAGNKQFSDSVSALIETLNEQELKLQIQAGLTPAELQDKIPQIKKELLLTPTVDLSQGILIETQLASSGFKQIDIDSGAALQTVLQLNAATNQFGRTLQDPKASVKAISQFLKAEGVAAPSALDVRAVGGQVTELFAGSDIQFEDLKDLAKVSAGLNQFGLSREDKLASFSSLVDVLGGPEAATALKQIPAFSRGAGFTKQGQAALSSLGLKPADVDLVGEDIVDVGKRFNAALASVDEITGSKALQDIFGKKVQANAATFFSLIETTEKRREILQGGAFERNVGTFQDSRFAENQRTKIETQFLQRMAGQETTWKEMRDELGLVRARLATENLSTFDQFRFGAGVVATGLSNIGLESLGFTPRGSGAEAALSEFGDLARPVEQELLKENNRLLEKIANNQEVKAPERVNRALNTE